MKEVYIVLTFTGTILSNLIKIRTHEEYAHSSIALDKELEKLYSFGRLNPYNAFWGGFVKEGITIGTFKRFKNTKAGIYRVEVTDAQYDNLVKVIQDIEENKKMYKFNVLGLALAGMNKKTQRENAFYCAEFVKHVLETADIDIGKLPDAIKPEDFKQTKNAKLIYKGYLKEYK